MGPISIWHSLSNSERILIECQETYQKKSYRNKCEIFGSSGVELLSIPLKSGKHKSISIKDVLISNEVNWRKKHLHSIKEAYVRAPFYDYYYPSLEKLYSNETPFLYDFNINMFNWLTQKLNIQASIEETKAFEKEYEILDLRGLKYSKATMDFDPTYPQVYEYKYGFKADVGIIDLLMNLGPESESFLKELNIVITNSN